MKNRSRTWLERTAVITLQMAKQWHDSVGDFREILTSSEMPLVAIRNDHNIILSSDYGSRKLVPMHINLLNGNESRSNGQLLILSPALCG